jgi:hypothetical protein
MPKFLTPLLSVAMCTATVAALALSVMSFRRVFQWDYSIDGTNWRVANISDGGLLLVFINADAPMLTKFEMPAEFAKTAYVYKRLAGERKLANTTGKRDC